MNLFSQKVLASSKKVKGWCRTSHMYILSAYTFLDMPTSTMLLFKAHDTISSQRRLCHTISCVNGPQISANGCDSFLSMVPNFWTTRLLLEWFQNFTLLHIIRSAEPTSRSTMNLEQGGGIWRVQKGCGLGFKVAEAPKIKAQDIGVM